MLRVKIFNSTHGIVASGLEAAINSWLESTRPAIHQMIQSVSGDHMEHVVITFLYEDGDSPRDTHAQAASADAPEAIGHDLGDTDLDPSDEEPAFLPEAELPY